MEDENSSNGPEKDTLNSRIGKRRRANIKLLRAYDTALKQAQRLAYDAMEAPTRKAAISLARRALKFHRTAPMPTSF